MKVVILAGGFGTRLKEEKSLLCFRVDLRASKVDIRRAGTRC